MIANESFLASATLRDNVTSNARTIGYLPTSTRSSTSKINFSIQLTESEFPAGYPTAVEILPGAVFTTATGRNNFTFNFVDIQTAPVGTNGLVVFNDRTLYEGYFLEAEFTVDKSNYNQKFVLENKNIDTSTIRVEVQENKNEKFNSFYEQANNLVTLTENSRVYWVDETDNEQYELTFGDGYFGKKLADGAVIFVTYIQSTGPEANGIQGTDNYNFISSNVITSTGKKIITSATISSVSTSSGGAPIEGVESIKFRAPKYYGAQNRAVVSSDYETLTRQIYPAVDDIYVYGGEELDIPEYGRVFIVIKPSTGISLSSTTKNYIKESLNQYRIASLDIVIVDPSILYVEINTVAYYNDKLTLKDASGIVSTVNQTLNSYAVSSTVSKFGGAARFSRIVSAIDASDPAIIRNNTTLRMRKEFTAVMNTPASYEVCFEQALSVNTGSSVVYSTGFQLIINGVNDGRTYYFEDDGLGNIYTFYNDIDGTKTISNQAFGTVDYKKGEIMLGYTTPIVFASTENINSGISIRSIPFGQDIVSKQSVYLDLDIATSQIDAVVDTNILSS